MEKSNSFISSIWYMITTLSIILSIVGLCKLYVKAGEPAWKAIVPIYNTMTMAKIALGNPWLGLLILVPFVGWLVMLYISFKFIKQFNVSDGMAVLSLFIAPVVYLIVGFGEYEYIGDDEEEYYENYFNE